MNYSDVSISSSTVAPPSMDFGESPAYDTVEMALPPPRYTRHVPIAITQDSVPSRLSTRSEISTGSSTDISDAPFGSPLGAAHFATPEATSAAVRLVARLFPGSFLDRKLKEAEETKEERRERKERERQAAFERMTDEEKKQHAQEAAEMLERDRILGHNLSMLGM